jgi:hypothetical protein
MTNTIAAGGDARQARFPARGQPERDERDGGNRAGNVTARWLNPPARLPRGPDTEQVRSGDGPLSVRVRPSSPKRDSDRRTTGSGGKAPINVHVKSRLTLEPLCTLRPETKGQAGACPDRTRAIPCTVPGDDGESIQDPEHARNGLADCGDK